MTVYLSDKDPVAAASVLVATARRERFGFLTDDDVQVLASSPVHRLLPLLVRCGGCRLVVPADQCGHVVGIVTREGSDYVRDVSIAAQGGA